MPEENEIKAVFNLYRTDFDGLENHIRNAREEQLVAVFTDYKNLKSAVEAILPIKMYLGWDDEVYPKFRVERVLTNVVKGAS